MYWVLEFLGCNSPQLFCTVHFFDGGIEQWESFGGKLDVGDSSPPKAQFKAKVITSRLATSEEVLRVAKRRAKAILIDARTEAEYRQFGYENVADYDDSWIVYGSNVNYPAEDEPWFNFIEVNQTAKEVKELNKELHELRQK